MSRLLYQQRRSASAPVRTASAAVRTACAPVRTACAPVRTACAPVRTPCAPVRTACCPVRTACSAVRTACAPVPTACAPVRTAFAPVRTARPSCPKIVSLRKTFGRSCAVEGVGTYFYYRIACTMPAAPRGHACLIAPTSVAADRPSPPAAATHRRPASVFRRAFSGDRISSDFCLFSVCFCGISRFDVRWWCSINVLASFDTVDGDRYPSFVAQVFDVCTASLKNPRARARAAAFALVRT
jgi:hypothetical protein